MGFADLSDSSVASVDDGRGGGDSGEFFGLFQYFWQGVPVVNIFRVGDSSDDEAPGFGQGNGGFGAKFVFLVFLALGDAVDVGLVEGIDFVGVGFLLGEDSVVALQILLVFFERSG